MSPHHPGDAVYSFLLLPTAWILLADGSMSALAQTSLITDDERAKWAVPKNGLMEERLNDTAGLHREQAVNRSNALPTRPLAASRIACNPGVSAPKPEWIAGAGNTRAMFEKLPLPWLRQNKDPRLLDYRKGRITAASEAAAAERVEFRSGMFERIETPRRFRARAKDAALHGHEAVATCEVISILRAHVCHSDFESWSAEFERLTVPPVPAAQDLQSEL